MTENDKTMNFVFFAFQNLTGTKLALAVFYEHVF